MRNGHPRHHPPAPLLTEILFAFPLPGPHSKPTKDPFNPDFVKPLTFEEAYPRSTKEYTKVCVCLSLCMDVLVSVRVSLCVSTKGAHEGAAAADSWSVHL